MVIRELTLRFILINVAKTLVLDAGDTSELVTATGAVLDICPGPGDSGSIKPFVTV